MNKDAKNSKIKESINSTRDRRKDMLCRVFEVKVDMSKMSALQKEEVNQYFREAKWCRNSIIADLIKADRNAKTAIIKVGETFEERPLVILGSQVRQDIYDNVKSEIKGLYTKKGNGYSVGKLKFKSFCNCIPLRQFGTTYKIVGDTIKVQNIKKAFKVRGLSQIPEDAEIANAKFVRKASGLYFHITCFLPKEDKNIPHNAVGIDFGIKDNLVFSDGSPSININIPESKKVKLASRRVNKACSRNGNKKSKNHKKRVLKLQRAYEHDKNKRKDAANKAVHSILNNYSFIAIQDEMIHNWHAGLFGRKVQHSAMGIIKAKLKTSSNVHVVDRSFPSTQICPVCGGLTKHPLRERSYNCKHCGYHHDSRDVKAARSILDEAIRKVSPEQRAQSPVEVKSYIGILDMSDIPTRLLPMKQEAQLL